MNRIIAFVFLVILSCSVMAADSGSVSRQTIEADKLKLEADKQALHAAKANKQDVTTQRQRVQADKEKLEADKLALKASKQNKGEKGPGKKSKQRKDAEQ